MILEGLVTTRNPDGSIHLAPMGPRIDPDWKHFLLRPFPTSQTYQNLSQHGEGVLHVTDDVLLLAKAALGQASIPSFREAKKVSGFVLENACRVYEFVVRSMDTSGERVHIIGEVVHFEIFRDFWGFNRAKHAVIEAAILATRLHLIPLTEVQQEYQKLSVIVEKTAGPEEREAFAFLQNYLTQFEQAKGGES